MNEKEQELLTIDDDSTQQEEITEEVQEMEQDIEQEEVSEQTEEKSEEITEEETKDNLTEKTIAQLEAKAQMKLTVLEQQKQLQEAEIKKYSEGKEADIAAYEEHEKAITQKEAETAKSKLELEKNRTVIDTMKKNTDGVVKKNTKLQKQLKNLQARSQELEKKQEITKQEMVQVTQTIALLKCNTGKFAQIKQDYYENKLERRKSELQAYVQEYETIPEKMTQLQTEIAKWTEQIEKQRNELKEKTASFLEQETEHKKQEFKLSKEKKQHKQEKPKDYDKLKQVNQKLAMTNSQIASVSEEKAGVKDRVSSMERRTVDHGAQGKKEILVDKENGEAFGEGEIGTEDAKAAEEVKVENAIKNAPIFKEVNKEGITKALRYNPTTGVHDEEEKQHDSPMVEQLKKLQEAMSENEGKITEEIEAIKNNETMKANIEKLKSNEKISFIETQLEAAKVGKPITGLLESLMNFDFATCISLVQKVTGVIEQPDFQKNSPLAYQLTMAVFESVEPMLDMSDKGDVTQEQTKKESIYPKIGELITTMISKIVDAFSSFLDKEAKKEEEAKENGKSESKDAPDEQMEKLKTSGKALFRSGKQAYQASNTAKKFREEKKKEGYIRILESTKRAAISNSIAHSLDAAAAGGQKATDTSAIQLGSAAVKTSSLISVADLGLKKFAGWSMNKRDQNAILAAPEVLGNVKYDEKKVPENRFNQILKEQTGITSKKGVYQAIKTTDAIGLHANMMNSMEKPNEDVDHVMSSLGYQDRTKYKNVTVADIMRKTGHAPTGGDWRKELQNALLVEGVDYKTIKQDLGDKLKGFASKSWNAISGSGGEGIKSFASSALGQIMGFASSTWNASSGSIGDKLKNLASASLQAISGFFST